MLKVGPPAMIQTRIRRDRRVVPLMRMAVAAVLAGGMLVAGFATTADEASGAATKPSYCAASRAVDEYRGNRVTTVRALLGRALQLAPREIAATIRTMRAIPQTSPRYTAAKGVWSRYNTNNCCTCLGGPNAPHLLVSTEP